MSFVPTQTTQNRQLGVKFAVTCQYHTGGSLSNAQESEQLEIFILDFARSGNNSKMEENHLM